MKNEFIPGLEVKIKAAQEKQSNKEDKQPFNITFTGTNKQVRALIEQLPRNDLTYYNSTPVNLLVNACRKGHYYCQNDNTKNLINKIRSLADNLAELQLLMNTFSNNPDEDINNLEVKLKSYNTKFQDFIDDNKNNNNPLFESLISNIQEKHEIFQSKFQESINKIIKVDKLKTNDNVTYLLSAQDRDTKNNIHSLGHFLNDQSNLLCEFMENAVPLAEYENTQVSDQFVLSETPKAFADAGRSIKRLSSLAYKKYVNTHAKIMPEDMPEDTQDNATLYLNDYLPEQTPIKIYEFLLQVKNIANQNPNPNPNNNNQQLIKPTWLNYPQRVIKESINKVSEIYKKWGEKPLVNTGKILGALILSPLLFIPLTFSILEWAATLLISSIALGLDFAILGWKTVTLIFPGLPLMILNKPKWAESIMNMGGLFKQSLTSRFQNYLNTQKINELNIDNDFIEKIKQLTNKSDRLDFLNTLPTKITDKINKFLAKNKNNNPAAIAPANSANNKINNQKSEESYLDLDKLILICSVFDNINKAKVIQSTPNNDSQSNNIKTYRKPKPLDTLRVGRSPVAAFNEIFLGFSDDLIGSFRQNYKLPSALGYTTSWVTMGLNVIIPATIVAKMQAKPLAHFLQDPTSAISKAFTGHTGIASNPTMEFFSLILEWKMGNLSAELMESLSSEEKNFLTHMVNNFEVYIPLLAAGLGTGYAFGMLPLLSSPFAGPLNALIEEAKVAHHGTIPLTSIEYLFIMGKLGFFLYTLGEVDGEHNREKLDEEYKKISTIVKEWAEGKSPQLDDLYNILVEKKVKLTNDQKSELSKALEQFKPLNKLVSNQALNAMETTIQPLTSANIVQGNNKITVSPLNESLVNPSNIELLLNLLKNKDSSLYKQLDLYSHRERIKIYLEINNAIDEYNKNMSHKAISQETIDNLKHAFFNRFLRIDYPAIIRLPFTIGYLFLAPLRAAWRSARLFVYNNSPEIKTSIEMERAVDKVFFDDWFGVGRRVGYQFFHTTTQSLMMLVEIVVSPVVLITWVIGKSIGLIKAKNPIELLSQLEIQINKIPTYLTYMLAAPAALFRLNRNTPYQETVILFADKIDTQFKKIPIFLAYFPAVFMALFRRDPDSTYFKNVQSIAENITHNFSNYTETAAAVHKAGNFSDVASAAEQIVLVTEDDMSGSKSMINIKEHDELIILNKTPTVQERFPDSKNVEKNVLTASSLAQSNLNISSNIIPSPGENRLNKYKAQIQKIKQKNDVETNTTLGNIDKNNSIK